MTDPAIEPLSDSSPQSPLSGSVLSPTDMVEGTDVTLRMLQHWVATDAVWPAAVHRAAQRRFNQWTGEDRDRLIVVAQVLEDLAELGIVKTPTGFVKRLWSSLLEADPTDIVDLSCGRVTIVLDADA